MQSFAKTTACLWFAGTLVGLAACSEPTSPTTSDKTTLNIAQSEDLSRQALAILNEKCVVCHTAERFDAVQFSQEQWNQVIERMVAKGAKLSGEEMEVLRHWRPTQ